MEDARLYTVPEQPVPVHVSGFGAKSIEMAALIADGFISTKPAAEDVQRYRELGGRGPAVAGYDRIYVGQMGPQQEEYFRFFSEQVRPLL
ncbi:MAG TPA: hypothetical protein VFX33_00160 [Actinomycetales bacterium]|nr:hypothetical protein [Actinomycetales bacterium]